MSGFLAGKVWQSALPKQVKPLAAALADIANDDGSKIYPSVAYVAWLLSSSERAVQEGLKELREMGVLDAVNGLTEKGYPRGGRTRTTEYRLIEEKLPRRDPWQVHRKGATSAPFHKIKGEVPSEKGCNLKPERVRPAAPDPSLSVSEPLAAPGRGSQDTRSASFPSVVKAERQFPGSLKALAKEKALPHRSRPAEPLRAEIWDALYWDQIEKPFLDGHRLSFEERVCDSVHVATTFAVTGRVAKLMVLHAADIEMLATKKLRPHLKALQAVPDLPTNSQSFVRAVAEHVRHAVTEAAAELYEWSEGNGHPPKTSAEHTLQVAV